MSKSSINLLTVVTILALTVRGMTACVHLELEQQFTSELLEQNTHSMEILGLEKDRANKLYDRAVAYYYENQDQRTRIEDLKATIVRLSKEAQDATP